MLAAQFARTYRKCDKIIVRTIRSRGNSFIPRGPNPGLDSRIRAFQKEGLQITDNDAEEFVEQSESDFYKVGEAYNEHLNETLMGKYEVRHQIKLLRYPWRAATEQRIARHDASVMRNWKELKEGSLDIAQDLRDHFLKFSDRNIPPLKKESIKIDLTQEKIGEFESIIKRCAQAQAKQTNIHSEHKPDETTTKMVQVKRDKDRVTLKELTTKIKNRIEKGKDVDMPDQIIVNAVNTSSVVQQINTDVDLSTEPSNTKQVAEYKNENHDDKSIMEYPERIRIPKSAYKKGATFKVNDCYYDHDGQFLYRVLGMSNK
ncbi:Neugrin [Operophtera brumata]|uniref:Neugrin n=1 Tax=Operophtera brumata TaxID=104452 RepID=A0A0L7KRY7_OPEBR|nr:Neugrin [Operophtera brumata]